MSVISVYNALTELLPGNIGINDCYQIIKQFYAYPKRYYHTLEGHICDCLKLQATTEMAESVELATALIFHDIIFDNVRKSGVIADSLLRIVGKNENFIEKVHALIQVTDHWTKPETLEQQYMVDIDLAILSAPMDKFAEYNDAVRREYSDIPDYLYYKERKDILQYFMNKDSIYYTVPFKLGEVQAKSNLEWALGQCVGKMVYS